MTQPPLLDGDKIAQLSRAARLSRRSLATMIGVSQTAIRSIETGRNHDELNGRHLRLLARALGVHPVELFARTRPRAIPDDDHLVVPGLVLAAPAGISTEAIALALRWTLNRADRALRNAQTALSGSGLRLIEAPAHRWQLRSAICGALRELPDDVTTELDHNTVALAARMQRCEIIDGGQTLSVHDQRSLTELVALGLATISCEWTGPRTSSRP